MRRVVASHAGAERYSFFVDEDEKSFIALERYRDAAALGGHAAALGPNGLDPLMAVVDGAPAITVLGELPAELRDAFEGMGARFTKRVGGFSR